MLIFPLLSLLAATPKSDLPGEGERTASQPAGLVTLGMFYCSTGVTPGTWSLLPLLLDYLMDKGQLSSLLSAGNRTSKGYGFGFSRKCHRFLLYELQSVHINVVLHAFFGWKGVCLFKNKQTNNHSLQHKWKHQPFPQIT